MVNKQLLSYIAMSFSARFLQIRRNNNLTQPQMADKIGIQITQVKRYEAGQEQPSIELLKKITTAFNVTTDWMVFEDGERDLLDGLQLKFEAVRCLKTTNTLSNL